MKRILLILSLLFGIIPQLMAGDRTEQQMKEAATKVLNSNLRRAAGNLELKEFRSLSKLKIYGYDEGGFAVVTTDDRFDEVIGYSSSKFSDVIPCGFKWWMESAEEVMENSDSRVITSQHRANNRASRVGISPLITTKWGQQRPFNDNCTFSYNNHTYKCVTGCAATAMAQVMNYHKYPEKGTGSVSYDIHYNNDAFTITFAEDFSQSVYDWGNMLDDYSSYYKNNITDAHTIAVAKLMKDCGVSIKTNYSDKTHGSKASLEMMKSALQNYFYYSSDTKYYNRSSYTGDWMDLIYGELSQGRPIIYGAQDSKNNGGHGFIIHGYDASTGQVYVNWGWDGQLDGYYDIELLNPQNYSYNKDQELLTVVPTVGQPVVTTKYNLSITSTGSGSVSYNGNTISNNTSTSSLDKGSSVTISISPNNGYRIKSVTVNGINITAQVNNNQYTISNINQNTTINVEFEAIPATTYTLSITASGNGSASYNGTTIRSKTSSFTLNAGSYATIAFSPDNGYKIKSVEVNNTTVSVSNNQYTISNINENTTVNVEFEAIPTSTHNLFISASGNGSVYYDQSTIRNNTNTFTVIEGNSATIYINPDEGHRIISMNVNGSDMTSLVYSNQYTISNIQSDMSVEVKFEREVPNNTNSDYNLYVTCTANSSSTTIVGSYVRKVVGVEITNSGEKDITITKMIAIDPSTNATISTYTDSGELGKLTAGSAKTLSLTIDKDVMPVFKMEYTVNGYQCIYVRTDYHILTISTNGYGTCLFSGISITNSSKKFSIEPGGQATIEINANEDCKLTSLKIGSNDVTSNVSNNKYTISNIQYDITVAATFDKTSGDSYSIDGHECVDLGLKSRKLWSTMNYGAKKPEEAGNYTWSKYFSSWGNNWSMPTKEDFQELINDCNWTWTERNGMIGYEIKGPNGNTMFLPAAGYYDRINNMFGDGATNYGKLACYMTSSEDGYINTWYFRGTATGRQMLSTHIITEEFSVRPISTITRPVSKYKLTYMVNGTEYKSYEIEEGTNIIPETYPTKEGYTFSGWSELPSTMPSKDVTVMGTFTINKYKLTYYVDGIEYKSYNIEYGASVTPEAEPTKQYYTFSGWSWIPGQMPANDVTVTGSFIANKYKLTYIVDGEEYKSYEVEYNTYISPESYPTKEGYTFLGWSDIPTTMPAEDLTVTGTFTINKYKLIYKVDGEEYRVYEIEYGSIITPEAAPSREGYVFSGWSWVPSTMPAEDVTVTGSFIAKKYKLIYIVDGVEYKTYDIETGTYITPEAEPTKEGYTFSGWSDIPETMPTNEVYVVGKFTINKYKITYVIDGVVFKTEDVEYGSTITPPNPGDHEGYDFAWEDYPATMPAEDILIYGTYTATGIETILANEPDVKIFDTKGNQIGKLQKGINILIYKNGDKKKVIIK